LAKPKQGILSALPGVDTLLARMEGHLTQMNAPKSVGVAAARRAVDELRARILEGGEAPAGARALEDAALSLALEHAEKLSAPNLVPVVNATGVVVHTNLGRSPLAPEVADRVAAIARGYSNLEFDLAAGKRGSRTSLVEGLLCELTGAEAALAVNNNAGAVLLALAAVARGREVIVSRGELVEIGGSFRIPDVMAQSGAVLQEVGTTNRTHPADYERAINENTGLLLKAHTSNFAVVGFTRSLSLEELVGLGKKHHVPVMEDLGSGTLIDFSRFGLTREPTVTDSVAAGADIVTFSGDKMLGGPQAGVILGKKPLLDRIKAHPLARALRLDKMTLAALEGTLRLYRDPAAAVKSIPTLARITEPEQSVKKRAQRLSRLLRKAPGVAARVVPAKSKVGGGALPLQEIPSFAVELSVPGLSANQVEEAMRAFDTPVIGRIEEDRFLLDLRTVFDHELAVIRDAAASLAKTAPEGKAPRP